jgi:hypothetical protein
VAAPSAQGRLAVVGGQAGAGVCGSRGERAGGDAEGDQEAFGGATRRDLSWLIVDRGIVTRCVEADAAVPVRSLSRGVGE